MHRRFGPLVAVALAACAPPHRAADFARVEAPGACDVARKEDFNADGGARLQDYARELARTRGGSVGLAPADVSLAIVRGEPKPSPHGVTAGEVACRDDRGAPPYRITLYSQALEGRPLALAYNTVAHEFEHLVQIRRDGLPCEAPGGALARYEEDAKAVADALVPRCREAEAGTHS